MHSVFSFLYAPLIVILLHTFAIKTVAIGIFCFGIVWLASIKDKNLKAIVFPLFYIAISIIAFFLNDVVVLKFLPLLISLAFLFFLIVGYFENESIILHFARKIHKHTLSDKEEAYIQRSTHFWIGVAFINILLHVTVLILKNDMYWVFYASIGWYCIFALGGVLQFLHRHFIFLKQG